MDNNELLDRWPPGREGEEAPPRADPIGMLFDGLPGPVILHEDEELPLQRAPSGRLAVRMFGLLVLILLLCWWLVVTTL